MLCLFSYDLCLLFFRIDTTLVRVMKVRVRLECDQLVTEALRHIRRFNLDPAYVKERIEELADQGYFAKDEFDNNVIHYVP
jgi:hypothetical protein